MFLKNRWYQAGWGEEVGPGQPLVRTLPVPASRIMGRISTAVG